MRNAVYIPVENCPGCRLRVTEVPYLAGSKLTYRVLYCKKHKESLELVERIANGLLTVGIKRTAETIMKEARP